MATSIRDRLAVATWAAVVSGLLAGCPGYTDLPHGTMRAVQETREGKLFWLQQSMFVGQFYDDDRYDLVDTRRFEETRYLLNAEGDAITPLPAQAVVPAGTRVRVTAVAFPTGDHVFRRPIYTPRYSTWIYLKLARERGDVRIERDRPAILLAPSYLQSQAEFDQWFSAVLSEADPNPRIRALPEPVRRGIDEKKPVEGMPYDILTMAMGFPDRVTREEQLRDGVATTVEVAIFGATSVVIEDGKVVRVSRPALPSPAATPAAALPRAREGA